MAEVSDRTETTVNICCPISPVHVIPVGAGANVARYEMTDMNDCRMSELVTE